jgi:O-antigen/teichoic acid export membrane protein
MSLTTKVFGATFAIVLANGITRIFSIVSAPVLTRLLGPSPYGVMALVGTFTSLASTIGLLGIDMSYARFFLAGTNSTNSGVERFCWRYAIVSSIAISIMAGLCWYGLKRSHRNSFGLALIVGVGTILYVLGAMSQTRARLKDEYNRIAKAIVISGAVSTAITIGLALGWRRDEWPLLVGSTSGILVSVLSLGILEKKFLLKKSGLDGHERWDIFRLGLVGSITAPMYWVLSSSDRWFIDLFWSREVVGLYSFAYGIATLGHVVNTAIILTWFPESARTHENNQISSGVILGRVWTELVLLLLLVWFTVTSMGGDIIRLLADPKFHAGSAYIPWIAGGVFFYGLSILATTGLFISKNMKPVVFWWVAGASINILSNYILIQVWGALGAAIVNCFSFGFISFGVMWRSSKLFKLHICWNRLIFSGVVILLIALTTRSSWNSNPLLSICFKIPICFGFGLLMVWFIAPKWIKIFLHRHIIKVNLED